ncbi:unnamed protein product [Ectocarpus sp. CCAP 1310/34]|nr:unnamed protein product [Ectocarpus sp. CCAP 1310/34]
MIARNNGKLIYHTNDREEPRTRALCLHPSPAAVIRRRQHGARCSIYAPLRIDLGAPPVSFLLDEERKG